MPNIPLTAEEEASVDALVAHYVSSKDIFDSLLVSLRAQVADHASLRTLYHSARWRVKEPSHLRDKLVRKWQKTKLDGNNFTITTDNLFERINDLAGLRLLHLHSTEFPQINTALLALLHENLYEVIEGPEAKVWDNEYKAYYESIGVRTSDNPRMYTSVHYVVQPNTRTKRTVEIQVRTLAEELWGEVDHAINYPKPSDKITCVEQIKVLARITSGCTRLVDSIYVSHQDAD